MHSTIIYMTLGMFFGTLASAAALPVSGSLETRDTVKLNQYPSFEDCATDTAILSHDAPISGQCYILGSDTAAFFLNTGGYLFCKGYGDLSCNDAVTGNYGVESGNCYNRDNINAVKCF